MAGEHISLGDLPILTELVTMRLLAGAAEVCPLPDCNRKIQIASAAVKGIPDRSGVGVTAQQRTRTLTIDHAAAAEKFLQPHTRVKSCSRIVLHACAL